MMENNESSRYLSVFKTKGGVSSFPLRSHPFWEILCYTQSCGQLRLIDRMIPFREGTIICVPPYVRHGSVSDTVFEDICVLDPDFPFGAAAAVHPSGCIITSDTPEREYTALFQMIYRTFVENRPTAGIHIRHLLLCVYDRLEVSLQTPLTEDVQIRMVIRSIMDNFTDPDYTASDAICACAYSQNYIRRIFQNATGATPAQYLRNVRLRNAESLLRSPPPRLSITEIAERSGFADPLYFSRVFRKVYGTSPSVQYAARRRGDPIYFLRHKRQIRLYVGCG